MVSLRAGSSEGDLHAHQRAARAAAVIVAAIVDVFWILRSVTTEVLSSCAEVATSCFVSSQYVVKPDWKERKKYLAVIVPSLVHRTPPACGPDFQQT